MINEKLINYLGGQAFDQSLASQYFAQVPFDYEPQAIQEAMDAFMLFLKLPQAIKEHIQFSISPKHRRGDIGYKHRKADADLYNDNKEFFHFHPALIERYEAFLSKDEVVRDFVKKALPIWELCLHTLKSIFEHFEKLHPGVSDQIFATDTPHLLLRFLKYEWASSGKYLAKPHYDAGSFTLAIAESCSGLRIGSGPDDLQPVQHQPGTALFFLSSNYEKIMEDSLLKPGWHDVIQTDETKIGRPFARWALVAFIDGHDIEALPRSETHKWYKPEKF